MKIRASGFHKSPGHFWFRVFGYGLHFKHERQLKTFSERNNLKKKFKIGSYNVMVLKPDQHYNGAST